MLEELAGIIPEIGSDTKYWFVRTDGGTLYDAFIGTKSIAIGHNLVDLSVIKNLPKEEDFAKDDLKLILKKYYPAKRNAEGKLHDNSGLHASQLLRFCREMKRGDVVLIPSANTARLGIGFIEDDTPYNEVLKHKDALFPDFNKRRKVKWLRGVERWDVNPHLFNLLLNHQTIVDATSYAEWIDPLLYDLFKKGDLYHFVLRVETREEIKAQSLFRACIKLFDLGDEFVKEEEAKVDFEAINTRINLNSPGNVELFTSGFEAILLISLLVVLINGGGIEFSFGDGKHKFSLKTEGIIKRLSEYLNQQNRRKVVEEVRKQLASLKIKDPKVIVELLKNLKL